MSSQTQALIITKIVPHFHQAGQDQETFLGERERENNDQIPKWRTWGGVGFLVFTKKSNN